LEENAAVAVKRATAEQLLKLIVTNAFAELPAATGEATAAGNEPEITGVHAAPAVCVKEKPDNTTLDAGTSPEFERVTVQARAFAAPVLLVIKAERIGELLALSIFTASGPDEAVRPAVSTAVPLVENDPSLLNT
jgi:hypothetical protein